MTQDSTPQRSSAHPDVSHDEAAIVDVRDILGGKQEVILVHAGERYRLRITSKGKLILTK